MPDALFFSRMSAESPDNATLDISSGGKALIVSDLHMGEGSRDDLNHNGEMLACLLEEHYLKDGWNLILNGDIEELQRYSLDRIQKKWTGLYHVFDLFEKEKRLFKLTGNHDEQLLLKRSYPYPLYNVIKIETGTVTAFVYHGHQLSRIYSSYNKLIGVGVRYFLKPFGIKNITAARSPRRRFHIEKKAYDFSMENRCLSIIGHTHRPLFESLSRTDYIKFEIERLCRDYPSAQDSGRIEKEVAALRKEFRKLKRKEQQDVINESLYGDDLPVPCLFNSGCALGKKGLYAIEITNEEIALVYWFKEGKCKKFVQRGSYEIKEIEGTPYRMAILNHDRLDYILARIKLLGNK